MAFHAYWTLFQSNRPFLLFGFLMLFVSSAGQTYFIGVFGPAIRAEFGLSHTEWGAVYLAGTLVSAIALTWTGAIIDRLPLKKFSTLVAIGLIVACIVTALTPSPIFLAVSIFCLRQTGQGLSSHTGLTAVARHFTAGRGKAIAIAGLGFAIGQAILPVIAVQMIDTVGWRTTYLVAAGVLVAVLIPGIRVLLKDHVDDHLRPVDAQALPELIPSLTRSQVLGDWRFYLLMPAVLAPSFIDTAMFFHHPATAAAKGWSLTWVTGSYWAYSLGAVSASVLSGPVIDKISARKTLPVMLVPLMGSMMVLALFTSEIWVLPYLLFIGLTGGITHTAVTALWAELYGVRHLGSIKSMVAALQVFGTALGPVTMGLMMDRGLSIPTIAVTLALYSVVASVILILGLRFYGPRIDVTAYPGGR